MTPATRARVEATIDRLIALLDADDGDTDLEADADREPDDEEDRSWPNPQWSETAFVANGVEARRPAANCV
jgi:hypothetical protein